MSNALAIATVTAALGEIVLNAARSAVNGAGLSTGRPDEGDSAGLHRVHLYLYQVTPNAALRNLDLPTRAASGTVVQRPSAALDLHYLLAFYGDADQLEAERMLGAVVRELHAHSVLTRADIQAVVLPSSSVLAASDLADAAHRVKLTPLALGLEELSKLWSVFFQTKHVVSVAYQASVVTIEADVSYRQALPVLTRGENDRGIITVVGPLATLGGVSAGIAGDENATPRPPVFPAAQLGLSLFVSGRNLSDVVALRFVHSLFTAPADVPVPSGQRSPDEVIVPLPDDDAAQSEWAAGIYAMTAVLPSADGIERTSNTVAVALAPRIEKIEPGNPMARDASGAVTVTIKCRPRVLPDQRAVLLLDGREILAAPRADDDPGTNTLTFVVDGARPVTNALVSLRVDGVDSMPFKRDGTPPVLVFDDAQRVTIT